MAPVHKIALIQLHPKPLSAAHNFAKAASFIREAAREGCALAVLPEYHLTSWVPEDPGFARCCAEAAGPYLARYRDLARETGMCLVPGTIVEEAVGGDGAEDGEAGDGRDGTTSTTDSTGRKVGGNGLVNVAYFLSPQGEILSRYAKKNLWATERRHLVCPPGEVESPHVAFDTPLSGPSGGDGTTNTPLRAGMLICWDLAFPEAFRELITPQSGDGGGGGGGAHLIIVPTFWTLRDVSAEAYRLNPRGEAAFLDSVVVARAFENTCAVVFVNAGASFPDRVEEGEGEGGVGTETETETEQERERERRSGFAGGSQVAVPHLGTVEGSKMGKGEGMRVVSLDVDVLRMAEENYRVREDLGREGWHYGYTQRRANKL